MKTRIDYKKAAPEAFKAMLGLENYQAQSGLEDTLLELIKIRASQINGCGYCLDMHTKDARKAGETEQRIYLLNTWRDTSFFTPKERAALAWTEAMTLVANNGLEDELYEEVARHFDAAQHVALSMAVIAINSWNRLAIAYKLKPGSYNP